MEINMNKKFNLSIIIVFCMSLMNLVAGEGQKIEKNFESPKALRVILTRGNCDIAKSRDGKLKVEVKYDDAANRFEPIMEVNEGTLLLREKFSLKSWKGETEWHLWVPDSTNISVTTASGNLTIADMKGGISVLTASGNISLSRCAGKMEIKSMSGGVDVREHKGESVVKNVSGDIEAVDLTGEINFKTVSGDLDVKNLAGDISLKAVSGDIEISGAEGKLTVTTATGDVDAEGITIRDESLFKVVSGAARVKLAKSLQHNISLASASGDVLLNFDGNPIKGFIECTTRAGLGQILAPFKFHNEEEIYKHGKKYIVKSIKQGASSPLISLKTATGKTVIEK